MNKRGMALILGFVVVLILSILLSAFFTKSINENNLVKRYINSMHAFWAAEAGVAKAKSSVPTTPFNETISNYSYQTTTVFRTTINSRDYYNITSTSAADGVRRTIAAIVRKGATDPTKFQYGIDAANALCFGGSSCNKPPNDFLDPTVCEGHACWKENDTTINFRDLFSYEQSDVENIAIHYNDTNFEGNVTGVNWVDVTPGNTLMVTGDLTGSGLLIIDGNVHFGGDYQFHGIIYVLGTLVARGTFDAYGSVVVASTSDVDEPDSINGNPTFHYSQAEIQTVLDALADHFVEVVSWRETQ